MPWFLKLLVLCLVSLSAVAQEGAVVRLRDAPMPAGPAERAAYALGWRMASGYRDDGLAIDPLRFVIAFRAALRGRPAEWDETRQMTLQSVAHRQATPGAVAIPDRPPPEQLDLDAPVTIDNQEQAFAHAFAQVDALPLRALAIELDAQGFAAGFIEAWWGRRSHLTEAVRSQELAAFERQMESTKVQQNATATEAGRRFLADYARRPDVTHLDSGVCYRLIARGSEPAADGNDQVRIRYVARRIDGQLYERTGSDADPGVAAPVPGMLPGLREALREVPIGSHLEVVLPAASTKGDAWSPDLPGGSVLIYDLHLDGIERFPGCVP